MSLFDKAPNSGKLRLELKEIEREQRQKQRQLQVLAQTKQQWIRQAVAAKQAGKQELVLDIFRKLRQLEIDYGYITADLRRLSLTKTAANSIRIKLESLERSRDRKGLKALERRLKNSGLQKAIDTAVVADSTFDDMLHEILGEEELAVAGTRAKEDAGFAEFDHAIGEMAEAEPLATSTRQAASESPNLAGVSGSVRRERISGTGAAAVSGRVRRLSVAGARIIAVSGSTRRLGISGAGLAAVSGSIRRRRISRATVAAVSGSIRRLRISGARASAISGSVRRLGISGAGLASVSGSTQRWHPSRLAVSGKISYEGISGRVFASGAAYARRGPARLGLSGKVSIHDESDRGYASRPTGAVPDRSKIKAVFEDARPMPRLFLDGRCGSAGRVVIIEGYGKASMRKGVPDDRMSAIRMADSTLVRLDDAVMYVKGKPVPIRGAGICVREGELSFLMEESNAGWFVREINSLLDAAISGAGPAVGELLWTDSTGEHTNVRRNKNVNWHTLVVDRDPGSLRILAPGDGAADNLPEGDSRFCRIVLRPRAIGDKLMVHTIDSGKQ